MAESYVVGPLLAKRVAGGSDSTQSDDEKKSTKDEHAKGEKGAKEGGTYPVHQIDNIVLNPAKSGGTRFLMVSAAFAVKDQSMVDQLKARDAEVRDIVLRVLGAKTVNELADPVNRDALREQLKSALDSMIGTKESIKRLYFPQFVIQ